MQWQIVQVPNKPPSSPELSTVDVLASVIEPKLANTLVRQLNQICPLENLPHVKRVQKKSVEGKVELSMILCLHHEHDESLCVGMPNDVLQLATTYQLSPYKAKVAKYAALSKEEWEQQCKLWPTSYHPSTNPHELTGFGEEESQLIFTYMKFAMRLMRTLDGKVVNAAAIVDPLGGEIIATGVDQTFFRLPTNEAISNCANNGSEQSATATLSFQPGGDSLESMPDNSKSKLSCLDFSRVSCMSPRRWAEGGNQEETWPGNLLWHPLRHATLVSIENAAARDRHLFPCLESQKGDCAHKKIKLSENQGVITEDAPPESLPSEVLRPYLCTGFDIYIVWEPCAMCAMALLHQRIRRIFYAFPNPNAGALGSIYRLQGEKSLNHNYSVYRILIPEENY